MNLIKRQSETKVETTWNTSRVRRDDHHVWEGHIGTISTAAGRSSWSFQMTSGNKAHDGFSQTTSLFQSSNNSPSSSNVSRSKCLEAKRDVTFDCGQAKASSEILLRNADYNMYSTFLTDSPGSVLFSRTEICSAKKKGSLLLVPQARPYKAS
jgi:hypothetical protein